MEMLRLFRQRERKRDELLSAYLDDQLSERERERLEARLADDPALRDDLAALRHTVSLVHDLPAVSAPRNFILTPTVVEQPRQPRSRAWAAPLLTAATAVVSFLFVIVLVGDLLLPGTGMMTSAPEVMRQSEETPVMMLEAPEEEAGEYEEEITSPPTVEAMLEEAAPAPEEEKVEEAADSEAPSVAESPPPPPTGDDGGPMTETARLAPTAVVTVTAEPVAIPTVPAEMPPAPEETVGVVETASDDLEVTPSVVIGETEEPLTPPIWPRRVLEIALGLTALGLAFATIKAWRVRR